MRFATLAAAGVAALVLASTASAGPYTLLSTATASGPSLFSTCTTDSRAAQEAGGSILYPNSEPEMRADVNPTNSANIVGAYQQDRWSDGGARGLVASWTKNGGATWHPVVIPQVTACSGNPAYVRASDPWVSFAPNGDLYAISLSFNQPGVPSPANAILVNKSTNGGESWGPPIAVAADNTNGLDKQSITADPVDSNYVYAAWDRFVSPPGFPPSDLGRFHAAAYVQQAFFSRTTNGGASWEPPRVLYNPGTQAGTIGSIINVLPDRTLVDGFVVFANHKREIRGAYVADVRSTDLGATWSKKATLIAPVDASFPGPTDPDHPDLIIRGGELPDFAVDRVSGKLYAVWDDDLPDGIDKIYFSQSADGGLTWSDPVKINKTPTNIPTLDQQAFTATVKVAADGTVGVTYYDFRNNTSAPGLTTDYWFVHCHGSCTDPANWAETHVAGPFDEEQAPYARGYFVGDYEGMVTIGNVFGPFYGQAVTRDGETAPPFDYNPAFNPSDAFYSTLTP
jgi:hypothetical protein